MLFLAGQEFRNYAAGKTSAIKHDRDFLVPLSDYLLRGNTRRGILITGLRSTGKETGVFQAVKAFPSDNIVFIEASGRDEIATKKGVLERLREKDYGLIFINEYSWLSDSGSERDSLAAYLAGKAQEGVKVIITGTDSARIHSLLNTDFIHRAVELSTTYFSYDEYCRLYELDKTDASMKAYLTHGGIFANYAYESCWSMKDYIKEAIIDNLSAYYSQYDGKLIEAAVYKVFYECICQSCNKNAEGLSCEELLESLGVQSSTKIKPIVLKEIFNKLAEIGVLVVRDDSKLNSGKRAFITNQTIAVQITKCIYELDELPEAYLENLWEASAACF